MRPSELGSKNFFSGIFSSFSDKEETGTFTGEPVRENLTAPPAGYQTPSPAQPYGLGPKTCKGQGSDGRRPRLGSRSLIAAAHAAVRCSCSRSTLRPRPVPWRVRPRGMRAVRSLVGHRLAQTTDHLGRACSCRKRARRRCRDRHRRRSPDYPLHAVQRSRGRGHSRSSRAGRDPYALVQGRLRRRDPGQIRARPFPRASDVQGHRQEPVRALLAGRCHHRRPGERVHLGRLHRLFPARAARQAQADDGVRGRPDDRPGAHRRRGAARAQRRAGRAEHAGRQQSRARGSASRWMPRSTSIIPMAGR